MLLVQLILIDTANKLKNYLLLVAVKAGEGKGEKKGPLARLLPRTPFFICPEKCLFSTSFWIIWTSAATRIQAFFSYLLQGIRLVSCDLFF